MYSTSAEDIETKGCHLEPQETAELANWYV